VAVIIGVGFFAYVGVLKLGRFPGAAGLARMPASLWRKLRRKPATKA